MKLVCCTEFRGARLYCTRCSHYSIAFYLCRYVCMYWL